MSRHPEFDKWVAEVRDPADTAPHDTTTFRHGKSWASYTLAQIPSGWASRYSYEYRDGSGGGSPWKPFPDQETARDAAIQSLLRMIVQARPELSEDQAVLEAQIDAHRHQGALW